MARRVIPTIAFHEVSCIYSCVTYACIVYVVKEVVSFQGAWSINGHGT